MTRKFRLRGKRDLDLFGRIEWEGLSDKVWLVGHSALADVEQHRIANLRRAAMVEQFIQGSAQCPPAGENIID